MSWASDRMPGLYEAAMSGSWLHDPAVKTDIDCKRGCGTQWLNGAILMYSFIWLIFPLSLLYGTVIGFFLVIMGCYPTP